MLRGLLLQHDEKKDKGICHSASGSLPSTYILQFLSSPPTLKERSAIDPVSNANFFSNKILLFSDYKDL